MYSIVGTLTLAKRCSKAVNCTRKPALVVLDQRTLVPRVESTESSPTLASEHVSTTTTGAWFHLNNTMASLALCTVSVAPMIKAQFADRAMSESTLTVAFAAQQGPTLCCKACYVLQPMASSPAGPVP